MEPSKAAIERANELIREITSENVLTCHKVNPQLDYVDDAFCRFIDTVDRVAREASKGVWDAYCPGTFLDEKLGEIMLPDEPDPLVEAIRKTADCGRYSAEEQAAILRHELAAAGLKIVKEGE